MEGFLVVSRLCGRAVAEFNDADQSIPTPSKCSRIQNSIIIRIHTISP
jgi:hypothetical protein